MLNNDREIRDTLTRTPALHSLYAYMVDVHGVDKEVPIEAIYGYVYFNSADLTKASHAMQQSISSYITRFNRRVKNLGVKIIPGVTKRTYKITAIK